jgi:hypothetical protein
MFLLKCIKKEANWNQLSCTETESIIMHRDWIDYHAHRLNRLSCTQTESIIKHTDWIDYQAHRLNRLSCTQTESIIMHRDWIDYHEERLSYKQVHNFNRPSSFWVTWTILAVKFKLSQGLVNYAPRSEDVWKSGGIAPSFLTSALDGSEWSASSHCRYIPEETAPSIHWIRGCVNHRTDLDIMAINYLLLLSEIELRLLGRPVYNIAALSTELSLSRLYMASNGTLTNEVERIWKDDLMV